MSIRNLTIEVCYLLLSLVFLIMVGCTTNTGSIQPNEVETPTQTETATIPTKAPEATETPRSTPTQIPPTLTQTPTAAPSTPLPTATLTREEEGAILAELMQTNGDCELPCWWGIMPGESSLETTRENFAEKGLGVESNWVGINGGYVVSAQFEVEDGIIQAINVGSDYLTGVNDRSAFLSGWQRYSLMNILSRHGVPSRVLVYHPFQFDPGGGPAYHLLIFYEEVGIVVEYRGSVEQLNGDHFRACPDLTNVGSIELLLYPPGQVENVVERVLPPDNIDYIAGPETVYDLISWQEATGTSLESFYETYSTPEEGACFEFSTQRA